MPINTFSRVPASSLLITVILSLVIGITCALLILLAYGNMQLRSDLKIEEGLSRNIQSAINLVLEDEPLPGQVQQKVLDLFGRGYDSAFIREELWGAYDVAAVEVRESTRSRRKIFFYGPALPPALDGCLYLAEHQRTLYLVGSTLLHGNAYLPKSGVKPGYIGQRGYDNPELVEGSIQNSDSLHVLDSAMIQYYIGLQAADTSVRVSDTMPDSAMQSFGDTVKTILEHGVVTLSGVSLTGHIKVVSDSVIEVDADARLDNVLLVAPVIRFKAGFSGRLQACCWDSLVVEANCQFNYPSSLMLIKNPAANWQPRTIIGDNCLVEGVVLSYCSNADQSRIYMDVGKGTVIRGVLYSGGYLFLKGQVNGAVMTDYFVYRTDATVYDNYLEDAQLDRTLLPAHFAGPVLFKGQKKNSVEQWVN